MDKEICTSQSVIMEEPQGSGIEVLDQTVASALIKEDISSEVGVDLQNAPKEDTSALKECATPEVCKVTKEVLGNATTDCKMPKMEVRAQEECATPEVGKVTKQVLGDATTDCELPQMDVSPLEECAKPDSGLINKEVLGEAANECEMPKIEMCVAPEVWNVTKEVLSEPSNECEMQTASIFCVPSLTNEIQETKNAENESITSKKEAVVIESVIQIVPANDELVNKTSALEVEALAMPSTDAITIDAATDGVTAPETDVIEVMDITQTEESNGSNKRQLMPAKAAPTSLGLLSQYGSDSDETISSESEADSVVEVPTATNKSYRSQIVEIESDSSATISSDSESETESEYLTKIAKVINKRIVANDDENNDDDDDEDDENNDGKDAKKRGRRLPPRVRGEMLLDDLPPIQDLQISVPAEDCIEFGRVHSIVDQLLLVSALPNAILLDLETVLFLEQGKRVLGVVFDVLGQVADPLYCIRFNSNQHIHEKGINIGDVVYVAPKSEHTQYVILSSITKMRGSDASWENDIEPPPRYLDYSDDEEEREARQKLRKHRRQSIKEEDNEDEDDDADDNDNDPMKRSRLYTASQETRQRRERPSGSRRNEHPGSYQKRQGRFGSQPYTPRNSHPDHHHQNTSSWHSHYNQQYRPRPPPTHVYRSPYTAPYQYQRSAYRTPPPQPPHFNTYGHPPMSAPSAMSMQMPTAQGQLSQNMEQPPPQMTPSPHMHSMPPPSLHMTPPPQMHSMPPPTHMTPPPQMHSMPPPTHMAPPPNSVHSMPPPHMTPPTTPMYVPNHFAFRSPTLSPQTQMQQPAQPQQQQQQPQPRSPMQSTSTAEPGPPGAD